MKILDWYIIKKFLSTFFFAIFVFTIISVVIDYGEKSDDFVKTGWGFIKIFTEYYSAFIPHIIALLFPLFVFIAVIFFTSKMATRTEIVAILASGVSLKRFLLPYFLTSAALALLLFIASARFIPRSEVRRAHFETNYVNANSGYHQIMEGRNAPTMYYKTDSFTYAGIRSYDTISKKGGPIFLWEIRNGKAVYNVRAVNIYWDTAGMAKKKTSGNWKLENIFERRIDSLKEKITINSNKQFKFNFTPNDLRTDQFAQNVLTTSELKKQIEMEKSRGGENVKTFAMEMYHRQATPVSVIILTMIGAIIAARKVRGGSGVHLAIGFVLAAVYILMDRFSTIFSTKGNLHPAIAAWIPNVIFFFVAIYLYRKSPK